MIDEISEQSFGLIGEAIMEATIAKELEARKATDFLPINGTDHLELYVGNAKQASYYYKSAFGFQNVAYAGPETGVRDRVSYVLQQGKIRLVLTTPLKSDSPISEVRSSVMPRLLRFIIWNQYVFS